MPTYAASPQNGATLLATALPAAPPQGEGRIRYIDNLRWLMIVLVVAVHAGVTYSGIGSWYYKDPARPGPAATLFFLFFQTHVQAFFMGLLFLIAGYFVPSSLARKGPGRFLADRAIRLGIPTLLYALMIHPALLMVIRTAGVMRPPASPLRDYARYVLTLEFLGGTGPLWFALALLVVSAVYAGLATLWRPGRPSTNTGLPGHAAVLGLFGIMAIGSFLVRLVQPIGSSFLNMQLCFFTQYVLLFAVGCAARRHDWLARIPAQFAMPWWLAATVLGPPIWFAMIFAGGALAGHTEPYTGGLHWQSAAYCVWESLFCVGACLGLLAFFRERLNHQGTAARFLSANAFAVYVFHPPVLVALALLLRGWHAAAVLKFCFVTATGLAITLLLAHFVVRRIPGLRRAMV